MAFITLNKNNFFYNLEQIEHRSGSREKIALVLKDNAYGHGLCEIAKLAQEYGIVKAVVRTDEEARSIEEFFEYVLVLADIPSAPSKKIHYTINDIRKIENFPQNTQVELKVDTGMGRNGISVDELQDALKLIKKQQLSLGAIFTHHSCADELNGNYEKQKREFEALKRRVPAGLRFHSCNSAALFREKCFDEDMVRVGIAAYGCLEMPQELCNFDLKPVLSLYARQISQREIKKGSRVGYGGTLLKEHSGVISNYDFGYADGFLRYCSHNYITPDGVSIAGRISMDNSSFVSSAEELLIFDDAKEVARYAKTISYEILTSLKKKLSRRVI